MNLLPLNLGAIADNCSKVSGKYATTGVDVKIRDDGSYAVASTDAKCLVLVRGQCGTDDSAFSPDASIRSAPSGESSGMIDGKTWKKVFSDADKLVRKSRHSSTKNVALCLGSDMATISSTDMNTVLYGQHRFLDGHFPHYDSIIPDSRKAACTVHVESAVIAKNLDVISQYAKFVEIEIHEHNLCIRGENDQGQKVTGIVCLSGSGLNMRENFVEELQEKVDQLEIELLNARSEIEFLRSRVPSDD